MNRKTLAVSAVVGLVVFAGVCALASGPGYGPGPMMGGQGQGQGPGGLVAVSPDGKPLPTPSAGGTTQPLPANMAAQQLGDLHVALALSPYPPVSFQKGDLDVVLTDAKGQAITDAQITLDLSMPGMWMPPSQPGAQPVGNGRYHASAFYTMRGLWRIEVIIMRAGEKRSAFFDVWL